MAVLFAHRGAARPALRLGPALVCASLVCGAPRARAASQPELPAECGTRAELDQELRQRLGDDAKLDAVRVSITPRASGFHLRVEIDGEVRELDDASCAELFRASVVIAVAMLLHSPPPPEAKPAPRATPPPTREFPRFTLSGGAGVAVGTLPHPVPAFELESKALWRRLGLGVSLRCLSHAEKRDAQGKQVALQALGAGVTGLFRPSRQWEARLGFAAQRLSGHGAGRIAQSHDDSVWTAGPTMGLGFVPFQTRLFWAGLGAEGQLNVVRGSFKILHYSRNVSDPPHEIYPVPWLAGAAFVRFGLVW